MIADPHDSDSRRRLASEVSSRERRKLKSRREGDRSIWFGLGMFGLVGWSVALPSLLGIALGAWLDSNWPSRISWKLTLLFAGVVLGFANAWRWMQQENEREN